MATMSGNRLPATLALVLAFVFSNAFGEDGLVDQSVDALFNLHDQLQDVVTKSVKGVGESMQEGPPPETDRPFTLEDLQKIQQKNASSTTSTRRWPSSSRNSSLSTPKF